MIPILYVGAPGIGKTAKVKAQYDHCEILLLSSCCEEDLAGLPYRDGNLERRTLPKFVESINNVAKNKTVCLFLDEIDKARREVADTLLTLITNPKHFGIDRDIDIVAAANPPEWGGGDGLSKAMLSRFAVVDASCNLGEWTNWAKNKYSDKRILNCIDRIYNLEIPLLETVGEDYQFRLTCPRTVELAFQALLAGQENLVKGLVTSNVASGLISTFSKTESKAESVSRSIGAKKIVKNILRVE